MSILYSFDSESEAIINPAEAVQPVQDFPETVLSGFLRKICPFAGILLPVGAGQLYDGR